MAAYRGPASCAARTVNSAAKCLEPIANEAITPSASELEQRVDEALTQLPEREQAVLSLRFLQGLNQQETAEQLGLNQATVSR